MPQIITRSYPQDTASALAATGISPLLARIYAARGIKDAAQLETGLDCLLPFARLKNAQLMAALLADAIAQDKKMLIVADYDADGATACAVGLRGLREFGARVDYIVPNRFQYGYGLTPEIVHLATQSHPDILITVDNGIASVEGVAEANRLGMQVLVTDHHLPGDALPDALCIVNPNQAGCGFPSKNLAGVGVMFYVLLALRAELRTRGAFAEKAEPNLGNLLDLVALGTVADVVKLDDNNRILVHQGLQRIRAGRACSGINALLQVARKQAAQASAYELGFIVGPRLNAAGRLEDMSLGIRCLLTDDAGEASQLAAQLDELNRERRGIEADMQQTALAALENIDPADSYSLALLDETWHQGVIGILASRLKDKFHRPVITFAPARNDDNQHGGELKGSGRSINGLHLRDALDLLSKRHPHLLQKFGGHAMAAGMSIRAEHFGEFQAAFETIAQELLSPADLTKIVETDGTLTKADFSMETARGLERQVWGQGFPQPLFEGDFTVQQQRVVGEKHLKLQLRHVTPRGGEAGGCPAASQRPFRTGAPSHTNNLDSNLSGALLESESGILDAMLFFNADPLPANIHAVFSLGINEYKGNASLQLIIRHWQATVP
ncbi:MAG TPA: single-stranded-DNA-specific exonuclease RecJ [Gallionellaceae bacterium]|nr:single-stranded-DNA-specific exonuclease RecJ [Gallionellaceae bacterium]